MRVGGAYESVARGVSEQAPQDRRSGQMWEQVNMISDPVRGIVRRQGSEYKSSIRIGAAVKDVYQLEQVAPNFITKTYFCNGDEYELIYTRHKKSEREPLSPLYCYNKTKNKFLTVKPDNGAVWNAILNNGISSMVNIGKFMFISANGYTGEWQIKDSIPSDNASKSGAIWIRNGDYSRTYALLIVMQDGTQKKVEYKTPTSSYPGKLDTSQVKVPEIKTDDNPNTDELNKRLAVFQQEMSEYNKKVADIQNEYNSAVTKYTGESAAAIQPENIAKQLRDQIVKVIPQQHVGQQGAYIYFSENSGIRSVSVEDMGDDSYLRVVVNNIDGPEKLTPKHYVGKIVRVTPKKQTGKDVYYLKAFPKSGIGSGFTDVTWREAAGQESIPKQFFALCYAIGDVLHVGSTPESLQSSIGSSVTIPKFKVSTVGDTTSSPLPSFFGKQIDYLGVFQDRLLIGTGAIIFASKPGDYFNWFRSSVLTVEDNDPVEMFALGSEDDTISWDTTFDRNHVLFGRKYQYLIPGRTLLSPKNPSIQVMSANEDAVEAEPQSSGNFVFYAKDTARKGSLHQIQMGATADSSESYECSQQLDKYIWGKPTQLLCTTAPFVVVMRTRRYPYGLYLYTYLDSMQGTERLFDSWSRWEWHTKLGPSVGVSKYRGDVLVFTVRNSGNDLHLVCDLFTFDTSLSNYPYLDSWRHFNVATQYPLWWTREFDECMYVAYNALSKYYMLGSEYKKLDNNIPDWKQDIDKLTIGVEFPAYYTPTSPYKRDYNDKPVLNGRLTWQTILLSVMETGGVSVIVEFSNNTRVQKQFDGRTLGRGTNLVGRAPIVTTTVNAPVGREIRECKVTVAANKWLPLTVTGMEWTGQWFNRRRG